MTIRYTNRRKMVIRLLREHENIAAKKNSARNSLVWTRRYISLGIFCDNFKTTFWFCSKANTKNDLFAFFDYLIALHDPSFLF